MRAPIVARPQVVGDYSAEEDWLPPRASAEVDPDRNRAIPNQFADALRSLAAP